MSIRFPIFSRNHLQAMRNAAQRLHGEHDFRNFCKMDVGNGVVNYMRNIMSTDITVIQK